MSITEDRMALPCAHCSETGRMKAVWWSSKTDEEKLFCHADDRSCYNERRGTYSQVRRFTVGELVEAGMLPAAAVLVVHESENLGRQLAVPRVIRERIEPPPPPPPPPAPRHIEYGPPLRSPEERNPRAVRIAELKWLLEEVGNDRSERGDWAGAHAAWSRADDIKAK